MTKEEFVGSMKYLGIAYGKAYNQDEIELYYDFLGDYSNSVFVKAIKHIIKTSKFAPTTSDLINACDKFKDDYKNEVLEYMKQCGYFKIPQEYDKAIQWLLKNNVPSWFKEDMNHYAKQMHNSRLETQQTHLIGG